MNYDVALKDLFFSSVFLIILQIFSPEVTLIRDQVLINVDACDPVRSNETYLFRILCQCLNGKR